MANKNISGDVNVEFTEAQSRQSLESGESVKTLFGKLRKWLTDLGTAAFTNSTDYAAASHNQPSSTITSMTGYSKPQSTSAIAATDTLNEAIGKLEKAVDDAGGGLQPGNVDVSTNSVTLTSSSPTATVTLSNATGAIHIQTQGFGFTASLSGNSITITMENGGVGNVIVFVSQNGTYACTFKFISVTAFPSWENGSDEMIAYMIQAHRDGLINLTDYWTVGSVRTITNLDTSTITSETIDLVLASGITYTDANDQTKTSTFNILGVQNRCIGLNYLSGASANRYALDFSYAQDIQNCIPNSLKELLLNRKILSGESHISPTETYTTTKYTYGGQYIGGLTYFSSTYSGSNPSPSTDPSSNATYGSNRATYSYRNYAWYYIYYKNSSLSLQSMSVKYDSMSNRYAQVVTSMLI